MSSQSERSERIKTRYECGRCGEEQQISVAPVDAGGSIRYVCAGRCSDVTEHHPAGVPDWFNGLGQ